MGWKSPRSFVSTYANVCGFSSASSKHDKRGFVWIMQGFAKEILEGFTKYQTLAGKSRIEFRVS